MSCNLIQDGSIPFLDSSDLRRENQANMRYKNAEVAMIFNERMHLEKRANSLLLQAVKGLRARDQEAVGHVFGCYARSMLDQYRDPFGNIIEQDAIRRIYDRVALQIHPWLCNAIREKITPRTWEAIYHLARAYSCMGACQSEDALQHLSTASNLLEQIKRDGKDC
jgi:hypothetical protein